MRDIARLNYVDDPNFITLAQKLEECSKNKMTCDRCPRLIRESCQFYWDNQCTGISRGLNITDRTLKRHINQLRNCGAKI